MPHQLLVELASYLLSESYFLAEGGIATDIGAPWRLKNDRLRVGLCLAHSKSNQSRRGLFDGTVNWIGVASRLRRRYLEILEWFRSHKLRQKFRKSPETVAAVARVNF